MPKLKILFLGIMTVVACVHCATPKGFVIKESYAGLSDIRKMITVAIAKARDISENGREIYTDYFDKKGQYVSPADAARLRYYAHILILGERRPYLVEVRVQREGRTKSGNYKDLGMDLQFSQSLGTKLQEMLNKSLDNRNMIDDFKVF